LIARNIIPPESIVADGRLHRCDVAGPRGRGDAAYLLHLDDAPAGGLENWRDGQSWQTWRLDFGRDLSPVDQEAFARISNVAKVARDNEASLRHEAARHVAARIWSVSRPAPPTHMDLVRNGVDALGLRIHKGVLVVPVRDLAGTLHSLQFISPSGVKRFLKGGRIQGLCCWVGTLADLTQDDESTLCVAEGFATSASLHQAAGHPGSLPSMRAISAQWQVPCEHGTPGRASSCAPTTTDTPLAIRGTRKRRKPRAGWEDGSPCQTSVPSGPLMPPTSMTCTGCAACHQC